MSKIPTILKYQPKEIEEKWLPKWEGNEPIDVDLVEKQQEIKRKSMLERERRREIEDDSRFRKRRRKFTPEEKAILLEHFSGLNDYRERNGLSRWITIAEVLTYVPVLRADFCSHCHKSAEAIEYITNGGEHTICLSCGHKRFYSCL